MKKSEATVKKENAHLASSQVQQQPPQRYLQNKDDLHFEVDLRSYGKDQSTPRPKDELPEKRKLENKKCFLQFSNCKLLSPYGRFRRKVSVLTRVLGALS